jgi:hypothetical protein
MRLLVALSTVAMIGLSSTAMGVESAPSQILSGNLTQSLEVRQSPKQADEFSVVRTGRAGGFFGRIMELERRKNAWLRGMVR